MCYPTQPNSEPALPVHHTVCWERRSQHRPVAARALILRLRFELCDALSEVPDGLAKVLDSLTKILRRIVLDVDSFAEVCDSVREGLHLELMELSNYMLD